MLLPLLVSGLNGGSGSLDLTLLNVENPAKICPCQYTDSAIEEQNLLSDLTVVTFCRKETVC